MVRSNSLEQLACHDHKTGPQNLMASHYLIEAPFQGCYIQTALQAQAQGNVVGYITWAHPVNQPQLLLC